jgi:glycosyltransferase involved in cell wall biosynthesis
MTCEQPSPVPSLPEVSVVIPTRNRWETLSSSALPAVFMQEEVALEVIVVDDGSTDRTQAGLGSLDRPDVRVVRHDVSRGVSAARNAGVVLARGEWLAFVDDDDIWSPRKLRTQVDLAVQEGADFVFSSAIIVDRMRRPIAYTPIPDGDDDLVGLLLWRNVVPGGCSNLVARTEVVRRLGGFDERLSMLADWELWLRLALETSGARCGEIHVGYQQHGGNMALRTPNRVFSEAAYFGAKHREPGAGLPAFDPLSAIRLVAWENFWVGKRARAARLLLRAGAGQRSRPDFVRGLQFLIWALSPDALAHAFWRRRHGVDPKTRPQVPDVEWLGRYDDALGRGRDELRLASSAASS